MISREKTWLYKRGGLFERMEFPFDEDKHMFFPDALGFNEERYWTSVGKAKVNIFDSRDPNADYPYLIAVSICSRDEWICVQDFPALLELLRQLEPIVHFPHAPIEDLEKGKG